MKLFKLQNGVTTPRILVLWNSKSWLIWNRHGATFNYLVISHTSSALANDSGSCQSTYLLPYVRMVMPMGKLRCNNDHIQKSHSRNPPGLPLSPSSFAWANTCLVAGDNMERTCRLMCPWTGQFSPCYLLVSWSLCGLDGHRCHVSIVCLSSVTVCQQWIPKCVR